MEHPILIYDGVCNLCNGAVRFIIRHDPKRKFRFAPMQGTAAQSLIERHYPDRAELDTFLLIRDGSCLVRSDAALAIARELRWPWPALASLGIVPRPIRDFIYKSLAKQRYRLFGRSETCQTPDIAISDRFLL